MEIKIFKCTYSKTRPYDFEQEVILATDADHAREIFCAKYRIRKNSKDLTICEMPFVFGKRVSKVKNELIQATDYRPGLGEWDTSHYGNQTHYYCDQCNGEVGTASAFCKHCGAYLT